MRKGRPRVWARGRVLRDVRVELYCINLGESVASWAEKFLKNLPHLPHLPRSKLSEKRISFEVCGSLVDLNLPRICRTCRICPRRGRFRDEMDARSEPFLALATV